MPSLSFRLPSLLALFLALFLTHCNRGGSEVENEVSIAGALYLADGKPAVNASVRIYKVDHVPQPGALPKAAKAAEVAFSTRTDAQGRYYLDSVSLAKGEYNILGELEGEVSYQDSIFISAASVDIPADTLKDPGSISGVVGLQPHHDPRTVTVQVLGTNTFSNVDEDGRFTLPNLAQGRYSVRLVTTEAGYTALYTSMAAVSGRKDTLADTLKLPFTGIPVVLGLTARYDTAAGAALLSWKPVKYSNLEEYQVYRTDAAVLNQVPELILRTRDTAAADTLFRSGPIPGDFPQAARRFQYRVRVKSRTENLGLAYGYAEVNAVSPLAVRTQLFLRTMGVQGGKISIKDTARMVVSYRNPTRRIRNIRWERAGEVEPLRVEADTGLVGEDTLVFIGGVTAEVAIFRIRLTDDAGVSWVDSVRIEVAVDPPRALAGADQVVSIGDSVHLAGSGSDGLGRIVKLAWDIGATGTFTEAAGGIASFKAPDVATPELPCILMATDDDGIVSRDTSILAVIADPPHASAMPDFMVARGDSVSLTGSGTDRFGRIVNMAWDIGGTGIFTDAPTGKTAFRASLTPSSDYLCIFRVTDDDGQVGRDTVHIRIAPWRMLSRRPHRLYLSVSHDEEASWRTPMTIFNGKIHTFGGIDAGNNFINSIYDYDPASDSWMQKAKGGVVGKLHAVNGKLYQTVPQTLWEYDPAANVWTNKAKPLSSRSSPIVVAGGKLFLVGGRVYTETNGLPPGTRLRSVDEYDPASDTWTTKAPFPGIVEDFRVTESGGKIYLFNSMSDNATWAYDPASDSWMQKSNRPGHLFPEWILALGGRIYILPAQSNFMEVYDVATDTWSTHNLPINTPWKPEFHAGTIRDNLSVHAVNGRLCLLRQERTRMLLHLFDPASAKWLALPEIPDLAPRVTNNPSDAAAIGDKLYIYAIWGTTEFYEYLIAPEMGH